jgi:hypothetical protein
MKNLYSRREVLKLGVGSVALVASAIVYCP